MSLFVSIGLLLSSAAAKEPFRFAVPDGWVDLSPGAPESNFAAVPELARKLAKSGQLTAMAIDIAHATTFAAKGERDRREGQGESAPCQLG